MKIEIDQSGRTEYTSVHTAMGDSLGNGVLIKAKDKRIIQQMFRLEKKPRLFMLQTFSLLIVLLIKKSYKKENKYVIDIEYPGHNDIIANYLVKFSEKLKYSLQKEQIQFNTIGKKSKAHEAAYKAFKQVIKVKPLNLEKLLLILFP